MENTTRKFFDKSEKPVGEKERNRKVRAQTCGGEDISQNFTISIFSRKAMEAWLVAGKTDNVAIISFHDPIGRGRRRLGDYVPIDFTGKCARVMQIALHDLDPEALPDFGLSIESYFPEARELAEFIYRAIADGLEIICQCEYGQSRSAGCAAAILEYFQRRGIEVFSDFRYYPNQLVFRKVFDALCAQKSSDE